MEYAYLSSTVSIKTVSEDSKNGVFEVEGLFAGYGLTLGNALRRTLLSSLPGAAATEIKIKGVPHEFSTLPGVQEDMVELALNFKKLRFQLTVDEPQVLLLDEPFSALDPKTTDELHHDLLRIWRELHITILMVSHLIEEAASLADRVVLMKAGRIEEIFSISLPYPRRENGLAFHELVQKIRKQFFA